MQFKIKKKTKKPLFLIITSFNQLYNFLSFFLEKKILKNSKIYLIIFSDYIQCLILEFEKYIKKFAEVEIVQLTRKSVNYKIKFFYYFCVFKKIFEANFDSSIYVCIWQDTISFVFYVFFFIL